MLPPPPPHGRGARVGAGPRSRDALSPRVGWGEWGLPPRGGAGGEHTGRPARHFVAAVARRHRLTPPRLSAAALERLKRYRWPGNVRELENCIESAVVLSEGEILEEHLPLPKVVSALPAPAHVGDVEAREATGELMPLAEVEKRHILRVLDSVKGNRTAAAKVLQIGRNTLGRKLKEYGIADEG